MVVCEPDNGVFVSKETEGGRWTPGGNIMKGETSSPVEGGIRQRLQGGLPVISSAGAEESQAGQLEGLGSRAAKLEGREQQRGEGERVGVGNGQQQGSGFLLGGATRCPMPGWLPWMNSPTRNTPSARRYCWSRNGGSCESPVGKAPAVLTEPWQRCADGNWKLRCSGTST